MISSYDTGRAETIQAEYAALDRILETAAQQQQALQLATAPAGLAVPGLAPYYQAVADAEQQVATCRRAKTAAEQQHQLRIQRERPLSADQAKRWYDDALAGPTSALVKADQRLAAAKLALGEQIQNRQALAALEAAAPARRAAALELTPRALAQIEAELTAARSRCAQ